jgi:hypothetical protein
VLNIVTDVKSSHPHAEVLVLINVLQLDAKLLKDAKEHSAEKRKTPAEDMVLNKLIFV